MELYFLRHGYAESAGKDSNRDDFNRKLTPMGKEKLFNEALGLKTILSGFDYILTSPLVRAYQTAAIFAEVFDCKKVIKTDALKPPTSISDLMEIIDAHSKAERILCVGHTPSIGEIATELVTGIEEEDFFKFSEGGLLRLDMEFPDPIEDATIVYYLTPEIMINLSKLNPEKSSEAEWEKTKKKVDDYDEDEAFSAADKALESMKKGAKKK